MPELLSDSEVEGRLNCFGEFDPGDRICMNHCALSIGCAIAKNRHIDLQSFEASLSSLLQFDFD